MSIVPFIFLTIIGSYNVGMAAKNFVLILKTIHDGKEMSNQTLLLMVMHLMAGIVVLTLTSVAEIRNIISTVHH